MNNQTKLTPREIRAQLGLAAFDFQHECPAILRIKDLPGFHACLEVCPEKQELLVEEIMSDKFRVAKPGNTNTVSAGTVTIVDVSDIAKAAEFAYTTNLDHIDKLYRKLKATRDDLHQ